jgi:predicted  nucleic acid-binding Zn-ribbon protein
LLFQKLHYNPSMMPYRVMLAMAVLLGSCTLVAQSLGDVAREERARKTQGQQNAGHVYTNDDISSRQTIAVGLSEEASKGSGQVSTRNSKGTSAKELQASIRKQKQRVHALEVRIGEIQRRLDERESIGNVTVSQRVVMHGQVGPGPCFISDAAVTHPYQEWCDEPAKLTAELQKKTAELKEARTALEDLQERTRRMGYGNAFYDPD